MGDWNGTVPTFVAGSKLRGADMDTISDVLAALTDEWSTWTPTVSNLTVGGSGTITSRYVRLKNGRVRFRFVATLASGFTMGGTPTFTLPVAPHASYALFSTIGRADLVDTGTNVFSGRVDLSSAGVARFQVWNASSTYVMATAITSTIPHTWAATDLLIAQGEYEPAAA